MAEMHDFIPSKQGNPGFLKALICSYKLKANHSASGLKGNDHLGSAKLSLHDVSEMFSMNAAACYLLDAQESADVDQWLEWEATQLNPLVHLSVVNFFNKRNDVSTTSALVSCLEKLQSSFLGSQQALYPIFWSTLFPLVTCKTLPDFSTSFPKISKWFAELAAHPDYATAVKTLFPGDALASLKEYMCKQPLPVLCESQLTASESTVQSGPTDDEKKAACDAWCNSSNKGLPPRQHPVLPKEGKRNVLITAALPYVNNVPHLGNIIGCVLSADVFSRFCRLRDYNSLYISGTDEYGTATETKAVQEGLTPQEICHKYNALHVEVYEWFNIDFDFFGRTTTAHQTSISQDIFWKLYNNKYIFSEAVEQLRCDTCARFLADRFAEGTCPLCGYEDARGDQCDKCGKLINATDLIKPKCKLCKSSPVIKSSNHLFLDLPKLVDPLTVYLEKQFGQGTWTNNAKLITKSWLRDGLKPRCITRDLKWGTSVPLEGFTDKVFYVWFDAPIGYISITANYTDQWEQWWKNPKQVEMYNFMAKDNVPFHSVVFPCTQIGADDNYTMVNHLCATEYLNYEDDKFSKSRGVGVFGNDAQTTGIPADIWRFYLLYVRPESQDSAFSWDDFLLKNNSELLNNLGNFVNRALKFVADSYGGVIPEMEVIDEDIVLFAQITTELSAYIDKLEKAQLRDGIWHMLTISRLGNQYFQSTTPWKLAKSGDAKEKARAASVVGIAANIACLLSLLVHPYMPSVSQTMREQMNIQTMWKLAKSFVCHLKPGHRIGTPSPLFAKIDPALIAELKKRFAGTQATRADNKKPAVSSVVQDPEKLSAEVQAQGSKVRQLKSESAAKSVIGKEVEKLLQLKEKLSLAESQSKKTDTSASTTKTTVVDTVKVEQLTQQVEVQGLKVRELKLQKADKSSIDQEVSELLRLKKELSLAEGKDPDAKPAKSKKKKK